MSLPKNPVLLLVVLVAGATVMSTEMSASRLLAPYFGTSQLIWANLIGLVLIYLTIGYSIGGRLADRFPHESSLYQLTAWAGFSIVLIPILARPLLLWSAEGFAQFSAGIFFGSLFSILLLFAVPLTLLGTVTPWAVRLQVESVDRAGNAAGTVYALSTVGSIAGTFLPVLVFQPWIGTRQTIWLTGISLLVVSLVGLARTIGRRALAYAAVLGVALALVALFNDRGIRTAEAGELLYEDESSYNYIQVNRQPDGWVDLVLNEGHATHSRYHPDHVLTGGGPWDYFLLGPLFRPEGVTRPVNDVLVIGLAAGTVPYQYARVYPEARIDGVEIDGQIVDVGREYFNMNDPQLNAVVQDGRYFLLSTERKYDLIFIDAYRQPYIPFHLATEEFFELAREHLKPGGVVAINVGRTPGDYRLVDAMATTMGAVFPNVFAIDTESYLNTLVYAPSEPMTVERFWEHARAADNPFVDTVLQWTAASGNLRELDPQGTPFTDDLAPVERVIDQLIVDYATDRATP